MILSAIVSVAQVVVTGCGAWAIGRWIRGERWSLPHPALEVASDAALGLLGVSFAVFLAALFHVAVPWCFGLLLALLALAASLGIRRVGFRNANPARLGWPGVLGLAYAAVIFVLALSPAAAVDELVYHLAVPRSLLKAGGTVFFPDNIYAYFPRGGEMLFTFGLALGGELAAKLFHALFGGLLGLALYGFARQRLPKKGALSALAFYCLVPSVIWVAPLAYVDLAFSLYAFLALVFVLEGVRRGGPGLAVAAGLMAGGAWSIKYTGLQWTLLLSLVILLESLFARRNRVPWSAAIVAAMAFLTALPWLAYNWVVTGWPLYPFSVGWLPLNAQMNWDAERSRLFLVWLSGFGGGLETSAVGKVFAPLLVFFQARFKDPAAYDGVIGPVFLLIPLLLVGKVRRSKDSKEIWILVVFTVACLYYWSLTTQQVRFLLPVVPVLAYLLAWGLSVRKSFLWSSVAGILVLIGFGMAGREVVHADPHVFWSESRQENLAERVFGYRLYQEANRTLQPGDRLYLVNMGNYGYLLDCPWRGDFVFEYYRLGQVLEKAGSIDAVTSFLKDQGITHLMINEAVTLSPLALDEDQRRILSEFLKLRTVLLARDPKSPGLTLRRLR